MSWYNTIKNLFNTKNSEIFSISKYLTLISELFDHVTHFSYAFGFLCSSALSHSHKSGNLAEDCKHVKCA